ncbi:unnamed protein product [Ilex paraguariensis]|uniref:BURP domain-containing protein n=1 Tax=Ilex paraguariensis TaxID=185542 RepID=A0ABC8UPD0_9AQUA
MKATFGYGYVSHKDQLHDNPNVALFFLEENIHKSTKMNLHFIKTRRKSAFLPHLVAKSIPFASEKMPEIQNKFSVSPNSVEAEAMKKKPYNSVRSLASKGRNNILALVASHAALPPDLEDCWKSVLQTLPCPKQSRIFYTLVEGLTDKSTSVVVGKDVVDLETGMKGAFGYGYVIQKDQLHDNQNVALFFLEKNIHKGTKMNLQFIKTRRKSAFLPLEAETMTKTIKECEEPGIKWEEQYSATSLEAMVDFSTSKLGKRVQAMSTEVEKDTQL